MTFQDYLAQMPDIAHLSGLSVLDETGVQVHYIPAVEGKLGSLKLYHALAQQFSGCLNAEAAEQGLVWFGDFLDDAAAHPGKHPNIDLLQRVKTENLNWRLCAEPR